MLARLHVELFMKKFHAVRSAFQDVVALKKMYSAMKEPAFLLIFALVSLTMKNTCQEKRIYW